jgi:nitrate reductase (cytochrome), electron transfer subunit
MKHIWTSETTLAVLAAFAALSAGAAEVRDDAIGLSKTSVFDVPSPDAFAYSDKAPNKSGVLPRAYEDAPPQVPHSIVEFLPIKADENSCLGCHDKPALMGKKIKGLATAMPESHYTRVDGKWQRNNNRYVCTLCHVPQADVKDLVGNTFKAQ